MITIPQSDAREQAENELAQWVVDNTKDRESVQILQRTEGCCAGNWCGNFPHGDCPPIIKLTAYATFVFLN